MYIPVGQRRSIDIQNKLQAVEIFNETERYREERALLIDEMNNLLIFYHEVILPSISRSISGTHVHTYDCMCSYVHTYIRTITCVYIHKKTAAVAIASMHTQSCIAR